MLGRGFGGSPGWCMAETMVQDGESATTELAAAEIMQASHRVWHEAERRRVRIRRRRQEGQLYRRINERERGRDVRDSARAGLPEASGLMARSRGACEVPVPLELQRPVGHVVE